MTATAMAELSGHLSNFPSCLDGCGLSPAKHISQAPLPRAIQLDSAWRSQGRAVRGLEGGKGQDVPSAWL